ncbi:enoyl-CoA hydratase [Motiliproteus coralliicola]|uniref:Enoyl-CoA hydratase n=1 Tax=Motiliproteus coralliicola TaxID=2283196 RepID=A0A369WV10_9GAMM|nr:enoyl-CoA hydratase [Motiliproteus coralliicola]RDE24366.1 enoyl-CoA hydratase [Motiliproteus coralliicola]
MANQGVNIREEGAVRVLELDNPARRNALSLAMYTELRLQLEAAEREASVRALVISGSQEVFCSGNDLDDFISGPRMNQNHPTIRFMEALRAFSKPVVAAVEGPAVGIGTTLLLHCDLVYAGKSAFLQMPFVQLGICPEYGSSYLLPRMMGYQRAAELLMLGERITAEQGQAMGLINQVVADAEALQQAMSAAQRLAAAPPRAMRECKRLLVEGQRERISAAMDDELKVLAVALGYGEMEEAVTAFKEKRAPDFSRFS